MTMWVASVHLDFWNVQPSAFEAAASNDPRYTPLWKFLNRYAGLRWAWQSKGAWIGFRDGLDAMDLKRFPEPEFGILSTKVSNNGTDDYPSVTGDSCNVARATAVCKQHSGQGGIPPASLPGCAKHPGAIRRSRECSSLWWVSDSWAVSPAW